MATITSSYTPRPVGEQVLRINHVPNPSFETDTTGWAVSGGAASERSGDWSAQGDWSCKVTDDGGGAGDVRLYPTLTLEPGETYEISADIMLPAAHTSDSTTSRQRRILFFYDVGDGYVEDHGPQAPNTAGEHTLTHTVTVPEGTTRVIVGIGCQGSDTDVDFVTYVDAVYVGQPGDYFDGDTAANDPISYRWTDTPHESASEEVLTLYDSVTETLPQLVLGYQTEREARTIVHRVLDRTDPDVSLRPAGLRSGTLELFYLNEQDAYDAEVMHTMPGKFTFTEDERPTASMTYVVADGRIERSLDPDTRKRWVVSVPFVEVQA